VATTAEAASRGPPIRYQGSTGSKLVDVGRDGLRTVGLSPSCQVLGLVILPDDEILAELTAIPGIGPWTVQGALLVALRREDVVLPGDLALRRSVQTVYGLDHLPSQNEVLTVTERWRPYRSLATSYLFSAAFEPAARALIAPGQA
jgi:hypothetical protein